jgi:hypothetical protein
MFVPSTARRTAFIFALQQPCALFEVLSGDKMNSLFQNAVSASFFP